MLNKRSRVRGLRSALLALVSTMLGSGAGMAADRAKADPAPELVKQKLASAYPNTPFTQVRQSELAGIYEVVMGKNIAYTDASGRYFFFGQLMDMRTQRNITSERSSELTRVDPKSFRLDDAIKSVKGDGSRTIYVFADPECGYCKQLEKAFSAVTNATVYTFLFPVLGDRSMAEAQSIWCSKERDKAWSRHMVDGVRAPAASCDTPIGRNLALGESMGVTGTPTIITGTGQVVPGAPPPQRLEALLNEGLVKQIAKVQP